MKKSFILILLSIMAIGYNSFAQEVDPFLDDAYLTQKDEMLIIKKNKEIAEREYQQRLAKIEAQRKADSIEYAKIVEQNRSMEIDAYNGHIDYKSKNAGESNGSYSKDNNVYGEYSSRIQRFHNGKTLVVNNPGYVNIYTGGYSPSDYYYDDYWYSPRRYSSWYMSSCYPWYDTYPYFCYLSPAMLDSYYYGWGGLYFGSRYYNSYYGPYNYYYGYYPYYYPYYSYSAGYYDGYYSGIYNSRYVNNPYRYGNRSYQSYSSPYESYTSVRNRNYDNYNEYYSDGYNSRNVNRSYNNLSTSNYNYNDSNNRGYNRSYRSEAYNINNSESSSRSYNDSYNSRSNSNSSNSSYNNSGNNSSSGYSRSIRR